MSSSILEKVKMLRTLSVDITNCEYYGEDDAVLGNMVPADIINALDVLTESLRDELVELLGDIQAVISDSRGIIGYHLNGDVALWDEFDCFRNIPAAIESQGYQVRVKGE